VQLEKKGSGMMLMKEKIVYCIIALLLLPGHALAAESVDLAVRSFELDKLLNVGGAFLAIILFTLTLIAYNRKKSQRLLYVCTAFFLFSVKGLLFSMELVFGDFVWIDPIANILDFVILLIFFFGMLKK